MGHRACLTGFIFTAVLLLAACGSDKIAPGTLSFSSEPDVVFFNTGATGPAILFEGRATDNRWVDQVLISFDNAATWHTAQIDPVPSVRDVHWTYLASEGDMPSPSTVLLWAADQDGNGMTSAPIIIQKQTGSTIGDLQALFSGSSADDVIALSSGTGGAYGDGVDLLTIPVDTDITVIGAGYGSAATSGGITPGGASTATVIEAPVSVAGIFSVQANLTLKKVRLVGAVSGVLFDDTAADSDPVILVEDCLFDGQDAWAVYGVDDDSQTTFEFLSSIVDASSATGASRGGLYLEEATYNILESDLFRQTDPLGPFDPAVVGAGIQVVGGTGVIWNCLFVDNGLAIWASGGSPVIDSCYLSGATAVNSYGINLSGESDSVEITGNTIDGNSGYGLRIGGEMTPKVRRNVISNNEYSGILIDFSGSPLDVQKIDLGKTTDFGYNDLFDNIHPDILIADTQLFVTSTTPDPGVNIPAEYNYWGVSSAAVESVVYHGYDAPGRGRVDFFPAFNSEQN